jgi:hypothetical protein
MTLLLLGRSLSEKDYVAVQPPFLFVGVRLSLLILQ